MGVGGNDSFAGTAVSVGSVEQRGYFLLAVRLLSAAISQNISDLFRTKTCLASP